MKRPALLLLLLLFCLLLTGCRELIHIEGKSMEPTLYEDDIVRTVPYASPADMARLDVIILRYPGKDWLTVKRIAGLPGDTVELRSGALYVNGQLQEEPYVAEESRSCENFGPVTIPQGHVFVLGDNRASSMDSRVESFGMLPLENVVSKVTEVVRPNPRPVE